MKLNYRFTAASIALALALTMGSVWGATIPVTTNQDSDTADGFCSLREALIAANDDLPYRDCPGGEGADRIVFDFAFPATILLTDHLPVINGELRITGPGRESLTLDGATLFRPINLETPSGDGWLLLEDLTLANGRTPTGDFGGGGARVNFGETAFFRRVHFLANHSENAAGGLNMEGGGIGLEADVTVEDCIFEENEAEGAAGGGAINTSGTGGNLTIRRTTFVGNRATHETAVGGGLLVSRAAVVVEASTFSGNEAGSGGGGIALLSSSLGPTSLELRDSTLTANSSGVGSGTRGGGGILAFESVATPLVFSIINSVVAGNSDLTAPIRPDIDCTSGLLLTATGTNFVGINEGCEAVFPTGFPNSDDDFVGTAATPMAPFLNPLGNHGGPTPVHLPSLSPLSPLIDQGRCPEAITDQRGQGNLTTGFRINDGPNVPNFPGGDGCEIGAVEVLTNLGSDPRVFNDGFESGNTLMWSAVVE